MRSRSLSSHLSPGALQSKCDLGTSGITGGLLEMLNLSVTTQAPPTPDLTLYQKGRRKPTAQANVNNNSHILVEQQIQSQGGSWVGYSVTW